VSNWAVWHSGGFEYLVQVPLQEVALGAVRPVFGEGDELPCPGVEAVAVAEVVAQPRADSQPVGGVDAEVAAVEQGVDVRSQQQAIVQAVLASPADGADMGCLEDGPYLRTGDRAAAVVGIEHDSLERSLAKAVRRQTRITEHRPVPVSGLAEIELESPTQDHVQKLLEIGRDSGI
jgi:hypothetical protein